MTYYEEIESCVESIQTLGIIMGYTEIIKSKIIFEIHARFFKIHLCMRRNTDSSQ